MPVGIYLTELQLRRGKHLLPDTLHVNLTGHYH